MQSSLTVILPLKGRETFNERWLSYHESVRLPAHILVGDGAPNDVNERQFKASSLNIEYLRFNDVDFRAYYRKLRELVAHASTPYVLVVDNDDFIIPSALPEILAYLDANPDYVSVGGGILGFYVCDENLQGVQMAYGAETHGLRLMHDDRTLNLDTAEARLQNLMAGFHPTWYFVHRREALLHAFDVFLDLEVGDVLLMEVFIASMMAVQGRQRHLTVPPLYVRQLNSSQTASLIRDFFHIVFNSAFVADARRCFQHLAEEVSARDGAPIAEVHPRLIQLYENYYRVTVKPDMRQPTVAGRLAAWAKPWLFTLQAKLPVARPLFAWWDARRVQEIFRSQGAGSAALAGVMADLDRIVRATRLPGRGR